MQVPLARRLKVTLLVLEENISLVDSNAFEDYPSDEENDYESQEYL